MTAATAESIRLQDAASVEWHGHWSSPWVGLCLDYAAEKGVKLEPMAMRDRGEMTQITGQPRMPAAIVTMADGSRVCLSESTRIIDLLDRSYPAPEYFSGWSADPAVRAQQELMEHGLGAIHLQVLTTAAQELGPQRSMPALLDNILAEQAHLLDAVNRLAEGAAPFFFGDAPSVLDYQVFHVAPFNRCLAEGMRVGKRDSDAFNGFVTKMPLLALLGEADFRLLPDLRVPPESDGYLRWRDAVDDRREANGLKRGCYWQRLLAQMTAA